MADVDFSTLVGLVSRYSPSGQERGAVEWLVAHMQSLGFTHAFRDEAGNAIGIMGTGTRQIVLLGHIDTVPGEIPVLEENGNLRGRGTVDAKGPLACFVDAVVKTGAVDGWQLVVIGAVEEERDSEGARFVVNRYRPEFAIVGEPNHWDRIALGYKGSAGSEVTVKREQMHSASGAATACESAVELWLKIKAAADTFNEGKEKTFDQLLITLRGMETYSNDFEQGARLSIGGRLPVDVSPAEWYARLDEILREGQSLKGGRIVVKPTGFPVPAWECQKNTPLVRTFLRGIRSQGGEPRFVYKTGTADLNIVAPVWGCPALVYGPGDAALDHTPDEHIELKDYSQAVAVLSEALRRLLRKP